MGKSGARLVQVDLQRARARRDEGHEQVARQIHQHRPLLPGPARHAAPRACMQGLRGPFWHS